MQEIGGYFSLELNCLNNFLYNDGIYLNSGRNSFEYILRSIPSIEKIWIPYYTCEVVLEPLVKLNIPYSFYHINDSLELDEIISLSDNHYLLYTNYFGIKDRYISILEEIYKRCLIVDQSQGLYSLPTVFSFYSPRKFVGLPDGGIAYSSYDLEESMYDLDHSYMRCSHLLKRYDLLASEGYSDFKENSFQLHEQPIRRMSSLTKALFDSIDHQSIIRKRLANFNFLHSFLQMSNELKIEVGNVVCPLVYPYYISDGSLRNVLIKNKIYIAQYWPNVLDWCNSSDLEYQFAKGILPLPIDQRYGIEDMEIIINTIDRNGFFDKV